MPRQNRHVAPWDIHCLTPTKLATFYRLVGGDYDPLFLDTPTASLSFIYQSLGCLHTLQPEKDPYSPPSIPALTPQGFVRWQTVQLLLEPDEHVPFLQEAVKRFEIINPSDGEPFPSHLPREALPSKPDAQMVEWHDSVSEKLMLEAQASSMRNMPPRPPMALSDGLPEDSSRPSSMDTHSIDQSVETSSLVGAASYFSHPRATFNPRPPPPPTSLPRNRPPPNSAASRPAHPPSSRDGPWSPLRRRSSMPSYRAPDPHPKSWTGIRGFPADFKPPPLNVHPPRASINHARTPSSLSTSSCTSDSSYTTSSASLSPVLRPARTYPSAPPPLERRHTSFNQFPPLPSHPAHVATAANTGRPLQPQPTLPRHPYPYPQPQHPIHPQNTLSHRHQRSLSGGATLASPSPTTTSFGPPFTTGNGASPNPPPDSNPNGGSSDLDRNLNVRWYDGKYVGERPEPSPTSNPTAAPISISPYAAATAGVGAFAGAGLNGAAVLHRSNTLRASSLGAGADRDARQARSAERRRGKDRRGELIEKERRRDRDRERGQSVGGRRSDSEKRGWR